jgi:diguanylate cyclase (GGDEF)-like protein/PAS domain S-box-containing protein
MQVFIFFATVFLLFTVLLAAYILYKNPKKNVNRLFAVFSFPGVVWCFGFIFMTSAPDESSARLWFRIMASGWPFLEPLMLNVILELTENGFVKKHRWIYAVIYMPAFIMAYFHIVETRFVEDFVHTSLGWAYLYKRRPFELILNVGYVAVFIIAALALLHRSIRKTASIMHKKQYRVMFLTILVSVFSFMLITYAPVMFNMPPISYLDLVSMQIWELGLSYAILRYGLMVISPKSATFEILNTMADGLLLTDPDGLIVSSNPALYELLQTNEKTIMGKAIESVLPTAFATQNLRSLLVSDGVIHDMEAVSSTPARGKIYLSLSASAVSDRFGQKTGYIVLLRDISERKQAEKQLEHMATHDALTNLPNRTLLNDRLRGALSWARRYRQIVGVLLVDVDRFKEMNDTLGHEAGDAILKEVAAGLSASVRDCDTIARMGGDEFMVILTNLKIVKACLTVVERIRSCFLRPLPVGKSGVTVTLSIGISIFPDHAENLEDLVKLADFAMYRVKASGRNNYQFYSPEIDAEARKSQKLEQELRSAISGNQFELYYQPIYATDTGKMISFEALLRWNHPETGLIYPMDFIPIAERSGLIIPIGEWVLAEACRQLGEWRRGGFKTIPVTVNVSARQFQDPYLISKIERSLQDSGVEPGLLELELTESTAMIEIEQTVATIRQLKQKGISIIIDDFGSGYSSMTWLKQLDVRAIKIDRFFIQNIAHDPHDAAIVRAIVSMAHSMGIQVVAEGIETKEQLDAVKSMKWDVLTELACDRVQGYLFCKPVSSAIASEMLEKD